METSQEIRRDNLQLLVDEVAQELKTSRGAQTELARRSGVPAPQISQVLNKRTHQGGGTRTLGDEQARKLERGMNKPKGWMDVRHDAGVTEQDTETLNAIRALTPEQRIIVDAQVAEFARLNRGNGGGPDPSQVSPAIKH